MSYLFLNVGYTFILIGLLNFDWIFLDTSYLYDFIGDFICD
jgi:hypothetical protein